MLSDLIKQLKTIGLPVAYGHWPSGKVPELPYLIVLERAATDVFADNTRFYRVKNYDVELYFEKKDPNLEQKIESFFDTQEIAYASSDDYWIESEKFYQKIYDIGIGEWNK